MNWKHLTTLDELEQAREQSFNHPVLFFKHSTTCSISRTALDRLERNWATGQVPDLEAFFIDLKRFRDVSNAVAEQMGVAHESPQAIVIQQGKVVYHASHFSIDWSDLLRAARTGVKN
ncbi:MAG TPA: bacillithiol system redox-active protein YtxJ [Cytophagales bacterium]|nr:bacillithiol system redox-active protein YtxJ [Cytophagales bacterium]